MPQQTRQSSTSVSPSGYVAAMLVVAASIFAAVLIRNYVSRTAAVIFAVSLYVAGALAIAHVIGLLTKSRDDLARHAKQLEEQAVEMQAQAAELEEQTEEAHSLNEELEQLNRSILTQTTAQLAEAQSLARLGSWEWDISRNAITWSDEMYRLYGLDPKNGNIDWDSYQSLIHPDDRPSSREVVAGSVNSGEPFSFHHRVVRPDGEERIFHARGKVILDEAGKAVRMIGTGQDVTEARRAESVLRNAAEFAAKRTAAESAAQHLNRVLSQAPVVIAVLSGPDHVFDLANDRAISMLGYPNIIGKPLSVAIPNAAGGQYAVLLDMVYKTGEPFVGREMFAQIDPSVEGSGGYFNFVFQPLTNDDGVYAILIVANEVSDLVRSRQAAEEAQHLALAASRTKSDFLARMSHELRTPLAAIIGYGELLSDGITGPVNAEQERQLGRIRSSANHLLAIIEEILTLSRMEAGKEKTRFEDVDLHDLLESVASMAEPLAAAKELKFSLGNVPHATIRTDAMKLRQVLLNLISNAVKYTDHGVVSLTSGVDNEQVDFLVSDTGIGIDESHLEKIFEPFWQVEQATTRRSGGTGLGLAVTRQFVDLLGGTVTVTSELGKGSTFRVTIPVQPRGGSGVAPILDA